MRCFSVNNDSSCLLLPPDLGKRTIQVIRPLRSQVLNLAFPLHFHKHGQSVRQLAESEAPERDVMKAAAEVEAQQNVLEENELVEGSFDNAKMMDLLKRQGSTTQGA